MTKYDTVLDNPLYEESPFDDEVWRAEQERKRLQHGATQEVTIQSSAARKQLILQNIPFEDEPHPLDPQY